MADTAALAARKSELERELRKLRSQLSKRPRWSFAVPRRVSLRRLVVRGASIPWRVLTALPRRAVAIVATFLRRRRAPPCLSLEAGESQGGNDANVSAQSLGEDAYGDRATFERPRNEDDNDEDDDDEDEEDVLAEVDANMDFEASTEIAEVASATSASAAPVAADSSSVVVSEERAIVSTAIAACRQHCQALEAANAAERALLFQIAREGAAERAASLSRERERAAAASARAAAGRIQPVRIAAHAWANLANISRGMYLEIRESGTSNSWIVRVLDVAKPEADAFSRQRGASSQVGSPINYHRATLSSTRRDGGAFVGALCVEPLLDPNRLPIRAECIGGAGFERLFPRHHSWPFAPWGTTTAPSESADVERDDGTEIRNANDAAVMSADSLPTAAAPLQGGPTASSPRRLQRQRTPAPTCRLLSLDRLSTARFIDDEEEIRRVQADIVEREVVVHYIVDNDEACPVKVEPSDVPLSEYHIDYEVPRRRPFATASYALPRTTSSAPHSLVAVSASSVQAPAAAPLEPRSAGNPAGSANANSSSMTRMTNVSHLESRQNLPSMSADRHVRGGLSHDSPAFDDDDGGPLWPQLPSAGSMHPSRRKTKLRVRHGPTGARIRCRSRRANSLSLDPVELYTAPLANGRGLNVLHLHVNSFGDDASVEVVDVRTTKEYADAIAGGALADEATKRAVEATKHRDDLFHVDASGRALDYAILADGTKVVAVLIADDSADDDDDDDDDVILAASRRLPSVLRDDGDYSFVVDDEDELLGDQSVRTGYSMSTTQRRRARPIETRFVEHLCPATGDLVALPDGALGILKGPLPLGLLIRDDAESAVQEDSVPEAQDIPTAPKLRDRRCRNCGSKCPEALPGIVDVEVVSVMAPSDRVVTEEDDDPTKNVDPVALAAVVEMGFDEQRARIALAATRSPHGVPASADAAVQWLLQPQSDDAATLAALTSSRPPQTSRIIMEPKLLDVCKSISYPVCALSKPTPKMTAEHAARVERKQENSANAAQEKLGQLERLLFDNNSRHDKKMALREARKLKALVDEAVSEGRLEIDEVRERNINRELRLLAFG